MTSRSLDRPGVVVPGDDERSAPDRVRAAVTAAGAGLSVAAAAGLVTAGVSEMAARLRQAQVDAMLVAQGWPAIPPDDGAAILVGAPPADPAGRPA